MFAQTPTGSISGNVTDATGAQVAGATVRLINNSTHETHAATTAASGAYIFPIVPTGEYTLESQADGFRLEKRTGITLNVNQNARADFSLQIGSVREVVEVKGDSPLVDTMDVQLGDTVDQQRIENLPLNGRNVYDLIALMPGAVNVSTSNTGSNATNQMNVNGNRNSDNNFYMDGGQNTSQFRNGGNMAPNPDAIAEFHLITSNFDAEYGRQPGSVLNVVTRSGSNTYMGTVFEFLRNDTVNARNFFLATTNPLHWNQYGGTFGGPIRKDKTFIFGSYQGFRVATNTFVNNVLVPSAAQRAGDFSALAAAKRPIDPTTNLAFPGGIIPTNRLDPVAQNILKTLVPLPNNANGTFSDSEPSPSTDDQVMLRIDHQLTSSNRLSGTLFIDRSNTTLPFGAGTNSQLPNWDAANATYHQNNVVISDDTVISPTLINQLRFSYALNYYATVDSSSISWPDWGSKVVLGAAPKATPEISLTSAWKAGPGGAANDIMPQSTWAMSERVTWVHGGHNIRAGIGYQYNHFEETGNWLGSGQVTFTGAFTGNSQADMLLGLAATFRQNNGLNRSFSQPSWSTFFQDNWRVHRKLTVELGLRWELNPPYTSANNAVAGFQFGVQSKVYPTAPLGMLFPGDPGIPEGIGPTAYKNFSPRVGFAYDPFGNGKTAVRGGYGIFYAVGWVNQVSNLQNQPFIADVTVNATKNLVDPWASFGGSPYPYTLSTSNPYFVKPISENYLGENLGTPYVQQYNFTVQQQLAATMSLQVAYVGNTGRKLYIMRDANAPIFGPGATVANLASRRPYLPSTFGGIYESETGANSNYNSLQVSFTRRFARNFSVMANFVWSKAIDVADAEASSISNVTVSDSNAFWRDRGPAGFNYPRVFNMSWIYQVPDLHRFGWVGKQVLGGWQLNGITTARSGNSQNVLSGTDTNVDGVATDRPNVVGDPNLDGGRSRNDQIAMFFNTAAFAKVAAGVPYGNVGRNVLIGPNAVNWNVAAMKEFRIMERRKLQFRTDFFNVFNEVNLGNPNTTLTNGNFGKVTSAAAPRMLQFGLKLYF